jgi:cytochrome P450
MATATTEPIRLPPRLRMPKVVQGVVWLAAKREMFAALSRRWGGAFTLNLPVMGQTVIVSDPDLYRDVYSASTDLIERPTDLLTLGELFGPGSTFSLVGAQHLARRRLLTPSFRAKRMGSYESLVEDEVLREIAKWPEGQEFETHEPMLRLTLGAILRAVFGAEKAELDELRVLLPPLIALGCKLIMVPPIVRRDYGRRSPGGRYLEYRRRFDALIDSLIADARADPAFEERTEVLALLLRARDENGEPIPDRHIADELLTFVGAGHETTASQLAWILERLRRHPELLSRLTDEVDAGGSELRQATIFEAQRIRSVADGSVRRTNQRIRLGQWVIPEHTTVLTYNELGHTSDEIFPDAGTFNPDRFAGGVAPKSHAWVPFGGGVNRCPGAPFAHMEMDVTLRTLLRELRFAPTEEKGERPHNGGIVWVPGRRARAVVYRRAKSPSNVADAVSVSDSSSRPQQG